MMVKTNHQSLITNHSKGFTLLELLVVLAIMGILTAIGVVSFTAAQVRARDSQRKSDLSTIASALESYFQKNKVYPDSGGVWLSSNTDNDTATPWILALVPTYIKTLPNDPKNTTGAVCDPINNTAGGLTYGYYSAGAVAGKQYILSAKLENASDPDIGKSILYGGSTYSGYNCYAVSSP